MSAQLCEPNNLAVLGQIVVQLIDSMVAVVNITTPP